MLQMEGLTTGYGSHEVVHDLALVVRRGEMVTLLGHNGAGKTTTLKAAVGMLPVTAGSIEFKGEDITNARASSNVRRGLRYMPEDEFVFPNLTVVENLRLGGFAVEGGEELDEVDKVLDFLPILRERTKQRAGTLSGGERRMLSIGMMLVSRPSFLLLDEPSLGLAPVLVEQVMNLVRGLVEDRGMSVLMVEQNVEEALRIADRAYVMRSGEIIHEEEAEAMRSRHAWWEMF